MKRLRVRNKRYIAACLLGLFVCTLKVLPSEAWVSDHLSNTAIVVALCGLIVYLAGYCLYRAVMVVNEYFTYSDLR